MGAAALPIAISTLGGGLLSYFSGQNQATAAEKATNAQVGMGQSALDLQKLMYLNSLVSQQPYQQTGQAALSKLTSLMGLKPDISAGLGGLTLPQSKSEVISGIPEQERLSNIVKDSQKNARIESLIKNGFTPEKAETAYAMEQQMKERTPLDQLGSRYPNLSQGMPQVGYNSQMGKLSEYLNWIKTNNLPMGTDPAKYGYSGTGPIPNVSVNKTTDTGGMSANLMGANAVNTTGNARENKMGSSMAPGSAPITGTMGEKLLPTNNTTAPLMGTGSSVPVGQDADFGMFTRPIDPSMDPNDPSYQWRLQQGIDALQKSAAARGGFFSGQTGLDLSKYGQQFASQEYENEYNRQRAEQADMYNRLAALSGIGQTSVAQTGNLGQNYGNQAGNIMQNIGQSQAGGAIGGANAYSGMMQGFNNLLQSGMGQYLNYNAIPGGSGGSGGWGGSSTGYYSQG